MSPRALSRRASHCLEASTLVCDPPESLGTGLALQRLEKVGCHQFSLVSPNAGTCSRIQKIEDTLKVTSDAKDDERAGQRAGNSAAKERSGSLRHRGFGRLGQIRCEKPTGGVVSPASIATRDAAQDVRGHVAGCSQILEGDGAEEWAHYAHRVDLDECILKPPFGEHQAASPATAARK